LLNIVETKTKQTQNDTNHWLIITTNNWRWRQLWLCDNTGQTNQGWWWWW